jgi:probable HAF family extracellular repeat protein
MIRILFSSLILVLFSSNDAQCAIKYSVTNLGSLGGQHNQAWNANGSGQIVGQSDVGGSTSFHAFIYNGSGPMLDLGTFGGPDSYAVAINNIGQVAGSADANDGLAHLFLYDGSGPKRDLGTLNGLNTFAAAMNDNGQIVGVASSHVYEHAFLYDGNGSMRDLGSLDTGAGEGSVATGINNQGQIIGWSIVGNVGIQHAFICNGSGPMQDMNDSLNPPTGWTLTYARSINDKGEIVGDFLVDGSNPRAFLYDGKGSFEDIGTLGVYIYAADINNHGQIVGGYYTEDLECHAYICTPGGLPEDLNVIIDPSLGWILTAATSVQDDGQILCCGYANGNIYPLLLTPVPEPAVFVSICTGILSFIVYRRHRRRRVH